MKRTNISLTDEQHEWLRGQAFEHRQSMSQLIRELLRDTQKLTKPPKEKCACIYVDGKLTEPCAHHSLKMSGIDPEKKPQKVSLTSQYLKEEAEKAGKDQDELLFTSVPSTSDKEEGKPIYHGTWLCKKHKSFVCSCKEKK